MLKRINILSDETANKIAAGEVVERPYSVVKELVENSIDAGAKNITIEILDGGQKSIKVIDDGSGIHPDDIHKAFLPHATSKILEIEDIFDITTLGFRGEALASIAAVSNTILKSRIESFDYGKELQVSGGIVISSAETGMNVGTTVEINDLFFNVPARLKFLKSSIREASLVSDIISRLALAKSDISFKLFSNGKRLINTYGSGNLLDSIRSIYGKAISDNLIYFENHTDIASVYGYIGNAEVSRGSRNNQSVFVNKRYIKSKLITAAVENAFKSFLTINKFPFFVLFLDIFPEFVDVNIHPTKAEIKFKDDRDIFKLVFDGVHSAIRKDQKDSFDIQMSGRLEGAPKYEKFDYLDRLEFNSPRKDEVDLPIDLRATAASSNYLYSTDEGHRSEPICEKSEIFAQREHEHIEGTSFALRVPQVNCSHTPTSAFTRDDNRISTNTNTKFPTLDIIGQFNKTYILAQNAEELYIIDQHAAHEKVLFEKYRSEIDKGIITAQILLTPSVLELGVEEFIYYMENKEVFENTGFVIEIFGDNTITIREVPYVLGKLDIKNLFLSIIDNLKNMGSGKTTEVKYDSIAKIACKSAIKANHSLSDAEIQNLIEDLRLAEDPFNCPHGRPTIIKIGLYELEKRFKRVQ
jgi:DNA mismatch repair protein MutL